MATASEIKSLDDINYKSRIKFYFYPLLVSFLFTMAFLNFYPIGAQLKGFLKNNLKGTACNPDYDQIRIEWLLPKVVVTDLVLPASCLGQQAGDPIKFSFITINFQFINFSPLGIPFKIDTEMNGQPLSLYFVQGFGQRKVRMIDQSIVLARLEPLMSQFKIGGKVIVDLDLLMSNDNKIKTLSLKAESKDFQIPSQNLQGFTTPNLKLNTFYVVANSDVPPRVSVEKFILGDPDSPMRANFKGNIDLQEGAVAFSPMNLSGEVAFSENFKQQLPLIDMMFNSFKQKDGFYQIKLGGTLGAPKPTAP
jgi:hypothetical protein